MELTCCTSRKIYITAEFLRLQKHFFCIKWRLHDIKELKCHSIAFESLSVLYFQTTRKLCIELDLKKFVMQRYQDHGLFVIVMEREMEEEQGGDEL